MSFNDDLLQYARRMKRKGASETEIRRSLEKTGWEHQEIERTLEALDGTRERLFHVHFFHKHMPIWAATLILLFSAGIFTLMPFLYLKKVVEVTEITEITIPNDEGNGIEFTYDSWPVLENIDFFEKVKKSFISKQSNFIEVNLTSMTLGVYQKGLIVKEVPIISKGKPGSWWETPAGLYKVITKEENHYSSFGHVYMPWSMSFQGNFFIHGWPYYDNGNPVPKGFSGGCVRLSSEDAKEVFSLSNKGVPVLVFEQSFTSKPDQNGLTYFLKGPEISAASYLAADLENNFVFAEKNPGEQRSIASLTKLVSALISVEYINVEREVTIGPDMLVKTSIPRLRTGDKFSILDLLSVLLMESSNEAALAIAEPLGTSRFVDLMNSKADAIGMENSEFADTSGVLADNTATAQDLFILAKYLYYNRSFILQMSVGNENRIAYGPSEFQNLNNLNEIPEIEGMVGGKRGLSSTAGDSMLAVFEIEIEDKKQPIAVIVLESDDSKQDIIEIVRHIQTNYEYKNGTKPALTGKTTP